MSLTWCAISQNKNPAIDIAKGIAIILVVYGHVIEHSMAPWSNQDFFLNPVFKVIYTFHMPLFVFISGYLMANSLNRKSVGEVFISRCKSLLVPFISLTILGSLVAYVLNGHVDFAEQLFLKPTVWFLLTLFVLSSLLLFSVKLEKKFGLIVFVPIYLLLMMIPFNDYCALYYIKWFYLFYLAGYFLNKYDIKIPAAAVKHAAFVLALIIFSWFMKYWMIDDYIYINKMHSVSIYRYLMGFLGIAIVFYIAGTLLKTKAASFLGTIGIYSLDIYIIQMFILEGIYPKLIYKADIHLDFNSPYVLYILAPLITIFFTGACLLISRLLIRKSHLLNTLLLGGRTSNAR